MPQTKNRSPSKTTAIVEFLGEISPIVYLDKASLSYCQKKAPAEEERVGVRVDFNDFSSAGAGAWATDTDYYLAVLFSCLSLSQYFSAI